MKKYIEKISPIKLIDAMIEHYGLFESMVFLKNQPISAALKAVAKTILNADVSVKHISYYYDLELDKITLSFFDKNDGNYTIIIESNGVTIELK